MVGSDSIMSICEMRAGKEVQEREVPKAVKGKKQGSRLSAFGHYTFSFQSAFMLSSNLVLVLETDFCVQHQVMIVVGLIWYGYDMKLVSSMDLWKRLTGACKGTPSCSFWTVVGGVCGLLLHGTLSTPGIWEGN